MSETINLYINRQPKDYRIYNAVLALLMYVGLGGVFISFLALEYSKIILLLIGLIVILLCTFFITDTRKALISLISILSFSLLYFIVFNKIIGKGLKIFVNGFIRLKSIKLKTILAFWQIDAADSSIIFITTMFLLPIAIIFAYIIYFVVKNNIIAFPIITLSSFIIMIKFYCISSISTLIVIPFICIYIMIVKKYFNCDDIVGTTLPVLIILLIFNIAFIPLSSNIKSLFYHQKQNLDDNSHKNKYEAVTQPLPEGKLDKYDDFLGDESLIALYLSEPTSETLYLRGFIGEKYEYGRWTNISNYDLYSEQINIYSMHQAGFYPQNQVATLGKMLGYLKQDKLRKVEIQVDNACMALNYNSYGFFSSNDEILSKYSLDGSTLIPSDNYSFYYYNLDTNDYYYLLDVINKLSTTEIDEYKEQEKQYRNFVYSYYLDKDPSLENELSSVKRTYGTKDYENILNRVKNLADSNQYKNSIVKSSFAAKALRYYGVPSRYVEGYVIPAGKDYATFKNAHAWVEYYIDGIGWAPFELCPDEIEKVESTPPPIIDDVETKKQEEIKPEEASNNTEHKKINLWYVPFIIIIISLCSLFIARIIVISSRNKKYFSNDYNLSVNYIFNRLLLLLSAEKITCSNTNLYNLASEIKRILGDDFARDYATITNLAYKGVFSNKPLLKDDQEKCLNILSKFINNARKQKSNLFYKYILWLY